ncbi:MAG: PAS domain-containing protein [Planctomycetes bacterium]|nr:PAS domain-containing protein [Planctomycetota bacterium]
MNLDSFFARIFLSLSGLVAAVALAAVIVAGALLSAQQVRATDERLEALTESLAAEAELVLRGGAPADPFGERLRALGSASGLAITLADADGLVVAGSGAPAASGSRTDGLGPGRRPALETQLAASGREVRQVWRPIEVEGRPVGSLTASADLAQVRAAQAELRAGLAWFGAAAVVLGAAASWWIARQLARPFQELEADAAELAAGRLDADVRSAGPAERRRLADGLNALARHLRARLEEMRRARTEVETVLSSMQEGVVAVDARERVVLMNQAAARLLGVGTALEPGDSLWERLRFPELERALRAVLAGTPAWHGDAASPAQDGRVLGLSVARVAHGDGLDKPLAGAVALLSDVTAIRRLEQVRIDFVANVSHELRTPLAAVMGSLETLADPEQEPETRQRFLEIGNRNAARLQAIVSDLLDLSSIEAEGDRMPLEPVRADAPLRTAAGALAGAAESKGVRLELPPPTPEPAIVRGNAQRLEQVFTNLLENAIKYTPQGGRVLARVRVLPREVQVDVEDSGMGIPAAALPRIFERFYRVDRSRSREMGGTGLGLAIVKHVVRAHGGTVSVRSEEGRGTTFTVALPLIPESTRSV